MRKNDLFKSLAVILVIAVGASAQALWDGTANTTWYNASATTYTLTTAEELAGLAQLVNNGTATFSGKTINLGANIALNDTTGWRSWDNTTTGLRQWIPIGNATRSFRGTFNGKGKIVTGLYINSMADYQGLFGIAFEGGINNLGLAGFYVKGGRYAGGISGRLKALPTLSCTGLTAKSYSGVEISTPEVACNTGVLSNLGWTNAPSWNDLSDGTYNVVATGTCDDIEGLTASCGTLSVCSNCVIDSRDGKTYKTVVIGTQTWMAENLNYDVPNNATDVCYDNLTSNCTKYGRLYNWATAMNIDAAYNNSSYTASAKHKGVCPDGWHIPSYAEWTILYNYNGGSSVGEKLKATNGWNNGNGTDDYGFSALPGGIGFSSNGSFSNAGSISIWWSSTESDIGPGFAWRLRIEGSPSAFMDNYGNDKSTLHSVRCLKN
ncbi:MAG: fibrobacter succinogenes major paralogous domain-containing protein [Fibromonadales bacterium]|nr:fibrobacter succinogenes major paralogous domain-containing protein [Fibromonadales bacterium]